MTRDEVAEERAHESPRLLAWRRRTDAPLTLLAVGSLPLLFLELARSELADADRLMLDVVGLVVLVAFAVDYVVELSLSRDRRRFVRREWTSLAIVVSQSLALVPALVGLGSFRVVRAVPALRAVATVGRLLAIGGMASREGRAVVRRHAGGFALAMAGLTWLSAAVAFTLAEDVGTGGRLESFFDALWWSTATITTVGYGDVFPVTAVGRLVGGFTMLVGISTFAIVTARIAEFLVRPAEGVDEPPVDG